MAKVGLVLACDGEKQFTAALQAATASVRLAQTELKHIKEDYKESANTVEALTKKQEALKSVNDELAKKINAAKDGLEKSNKNYQKITESISKYENKLKELEEKEKKFTGDKTSEAYKNLQKEINETTNALENERIQRSYQEKSYLKWQTALKQSEKALDKSNKELDETTQYLEEAKNSTDGCATSIDQFGKKVDKTEDPVDELGTSLNETSGYARDFGEQIQDALSENRLKTKALDLATEALRRLGSALVDAIKDGLKTGIEFEAEMSKVAAISGSTGSDLDQLTEKAKELGRTTVYSAKESAEAMEKMALAGWDTQSILEGVDGVLSLAASSGMEISQASEYVSDNLNAWGKSASYATHMSDLMATAMSSSSMTTEDLGEAYAKCASTANTFGYDIEDVTSALMIMANQGKKGGEAGTALNAIMTRLATNTSNCADKLGNYGIKVYDTHGNMRDLGDILTELSGAWGTMTQEEQAALAKSIAGQRQYTALSMIMQGFSSDLDETGKSFDGYRKKLEDCDGAAKDMSETMLNNLSGDLQLAKDAVDGLATAAYEYISGPARGVVRVVTQAINYLTDAISPKKSEIEELAETAKTKVEEVKTTLANMDLNMDSAEDEAVKVAILGDQLMALNEVEEKSATQKRRMAQVVQELDSYIPGLSSHYNEETGELDLLNSSLSTYLEQAKQQLLYTAALENAQGLLNDALQTEQARIIAQDAKDAIEEKIKLYTAQRDALLDVSLAEDDYWKAIENGYDPSQLTMPDYSDYISTTQELFKAGISTNDEYISSLNAVGYAVDMNGEIYKDESLGVKSYDTIVGVLDENVRVLTNDLDSANEVVREAEDAATESKEKYEEYNDTMQRAADNIVNLGGVAGDTSSILKSGGETAEGASEGYEKLGESTYDLAVKAASAQEAIKTAMQDILYEYQTAVGEIVDDLGNKIDLSSKFEYDEEPQGISEMKENLETQTEAFNEYAENLQIVTSHLGKEITPEFLQYLTDMGMDGATQMRTIARALGKEGWEDALDLEGVSELVQEYMASIDASGDIAEVRAAYEMALKASAKELGSTDLEFDTLRDNIADSIASAGEEAIDGWSGLDKQMQDKINNLANLCQVLGVAIPAGLADGIASGETSPIEAVGALEGAIQGQFAALMEIAEAAGLEVPENIASGLTQGGQATIDAYNALLDLLAGYDVEDIEVGDNLVDSISADIENGSQTVYDATTGLTDSMQSAANDADPDASSWTSAYAESMSETQDTINTAATEAATQAGEAAAETTETFESSGKKGGEGYASGISGSSGTAMAAASTMASQAVSASNAYEGFRQSGLNAAAGYAVGIANGTNAAVTAAANMAAQAIAAANKAQASRSPSRKFMQTGAYAAEGYAIGIEDNAGDAADAAAAMAYGSLEAAKEALDIHSPSKKFRNLVGKQIGKGVAFGIKDSEDVASSAAESLSKKVLNKATAWINKYDTNHKSSLEKTKYFWEQVKKHLTEGTKAYAEAVTKIETAEKKISAKSAKVKAANTFDKISRTKTDSKGNVSAKTDEEYYSEVLSAADKYVSNMKIIKKMSVRDELEYWKAIRKQLTKGTQAWFDATAKINEAKSDLKDLKITKASSREEKLDIATGMNVDKAVENAQEIVNIWKNVARGSKKNSANWKTAQQNITSAYDGVVSAAGQYVTNQRNMNKMSLEEAITYWKGVRSTLKKGTQAWYDATETIKGLQQDVVSQRAQNQSSILDYYKTYYKSKTGLDLSSKAEMQYWNIARKQFKEGTAERIAADKQYLDAKNTYYEKLKEAEEDYAKSVKEIEEDLEQKRNDYINEYKESVKSAKETIFDSMDLFESWDTTGYTADTLIKNLKTQVAGLALWEENLEKIRKRGVSEEFYQYLADQGAGAAANIYSIANMTDEQLSEYIDLFNKKSDLAYNQAEKNSKEAYNDALDKIKQAEQDATTKLAEVSADYKTKIEEINTNLDDLGKSLVAKAGTTGENVIAGIFQGLYNGLKSDDGRTAEKVTTALSTSVDQKLSNKTYSIGQNALSGILNGMTDESSIKNTAQSVVDSIVKAFKNAAQIHSPSVLFRKEIGENISAGIGLGIESGIDGISDSAASSVDSAMIAAQEELDKKQLDLQNSLNLLGSDGLNLVNNVTEEYKAAAPIVNVNNDGSNGLLSNLTEAVGVITQILSSGIALDDGTIIGRYQEAFSQGLAVASIRKNRGR